jgi:hypothetical protein
MARHADSSEIAQIVIASALPIINMMSNKRVLLKLCFV